MGSQRRAFPVSTRSAPFVRPPGTWEPSRRSAGREPWEPGKAAARRRAPPGGAFVGRSVFCRNVDRRCLQKSARHRIVGKFRVMGKFMPSSHSLAVPKPKSPGQGAGGPARGRGGTGGL